MSERAHRASRRARFIATRDGLVLASQETVLRNMGVSASASAAYDLLTDDGVAADKAAELVIAADRNGDDPEAFARHVLKLSRAVRQERSS